MTLMIASQQQPTKEEAEEEVEEVEEGRIQHREEGLKEEEQTLVWRLLPVAGTQRLLCQHLEICLL
uniref:Alternative protein MRE11A n=1 Tax=Homo sapiens TaxID=9606 RepID=L8E9C6_HUMAN|nr:alternative protein MRE11A [Homo sapiens]